MTAKKFLFSVFLLISLFFSLYIILFYFQLGAATKAEWWVKHSYYYKDFKAEDIKQKKIIIIAGSNALLGINSDIIAQKTGYPVVNLSAHADLDLNFLFYKIKQHINKGDIVVLPLEFKYYSDSNKISDWFSINMMAWGNNYLQQLNSIDFVNFFITTEPADVLDGVKKQFKNHSVNKKLLTKTEVLTNLSALWKSEGIKWRGYSYKSLNTFGDINANEAVTYTENDVYLKKDLKISTHFLTVYKKLEKLVEQHHARLYLTYPVSIRNELFNLAAKEVQQRITLFEESLAEHNINIQCNAALFNLDREFFFDTKYHTNQYGAIIRSDHLAACLNQLSNKNFTKTSTSEAISKVNTLQKKYRDKVKNSAN